MDQAENLRILVRMQKDEQNLPAQKGKILGSTRIIAITSGKGGVGKTNITLNMALALAKENHKKVLVLDADFGTANIDIVMGIIPKYNISHMLYEDKTLEEVILNGPHGIKILPGVSGLASLTALTEVQKEKFFAQLEDYNKKYHLDYILIDTGAGLGTNVINFLLAADEIIVIVTPEPTSLSDAYAIIKVVNQYDPDMKVNIITNMVNGQIEADKVFNTINSVSEKFLDKTINYLGFIKYDKCMPSAVKQQKPLMLSYPNSETSLEILKLSNVIMNKPYNKKQTILSFFELAGKYFGWNND